jgi:NADH:ubiquinone oxidoreductase subunit 6 (subunit J)
MSFLLDFSNVLMTKTDFFNLNGAFANIKMIAFALFSNFLFHFLVAGLVLLLAMIAAILLTIHKQFISKNQNTYVQILKHYNTGLTKLK